MVLEMKKQLVAPMLAMLALGLIAPTAGARDLSPMEIARKSVVTVLPVWPGRPANMDEPEGSGVVIGDGSTIVTADHVLGPVQDQVPVLVRDDDGTSYRARVVARHKASDLAVLRIDQKLPAIAGRGSEPGLGDEVCAIGNAFGVGLSLSCGRISAVHRAGVGFNAIEDFIQTDAAVNPGMSGGALVDMQGRFTGMLSAIFTKRADANIGVNFAVDARLVEVIADALAGTGRFVPARTGVLLRAVPRKGEAGRQGALVVKIVPGLAGDKSGLKAGDTVYLANGRRIRKPHDWLSVMAGRRPGEQVELSGLRDGKPLQWTMGE
ncbi:S1C family serine protease [Anderseniella sp. Alg231-50]|uniref:S1C family serine protease n=1 Tax=Anderseniella sp. Alg231-50 TaxID=1922226 RepID=UPI00307CA595